LKRRDNLRHGVYVVGMALESINRVSAILSKKQPVKKSVIYGLYRIGRLLRK